MHQSGFDGTMMVVCRLAISPSPILPSGSGAKVLKLYSVHSVVFLAFIAAFVFARDSCAKAPRNVGSASMSFSSGQVTKVSDYEKPLVRTEKRGNYTFVVGSVLIDAPSQRVWEILVDYDKSPEIFDNLSLCRVVGSEGEVKFVRQVVKPGGPIKFDYVVNLVETKPRLIKWKRRSGSFREVMGTWELEPQAPNPNASAERTKVTYSIHLDGGFALPPWLLASQVKGYLPTVLNSLKRKVESSSSGTTP